MPIGGKVMKMTMKSSMGAGQEMRKGSKTTTAARGGGAGDEETPGDGPDGDAGHNHLE